MCLSGGQGSTTGGERGLSLQGHVQVSHLTLAGVIGIWTRSDRDVPPPSSHRWAMSLGFEKKKPQKKWKYFSSTDQT